MPLDKGSSNPRPVGPVFKARGGQSDSGQGQGGQGQPPNDGLTDEERAQRLGELEEERQRILDEAGDRGDGLTEAERDALDGIDRERDRLSGLDQEPDGPASDDEAMTPEREAELDQADRDLDRQEQREREEPGDFPMPDEENRFAGLDGSTSGGQGSGSGGGSGSGEGSGGGSGGGDSGDGGSGGGSGGGGGDGGGDGGDGGGDAAMGGEDGGTEHTVPGGPSRFGRLPAGHVAGERLAEVIAGRQGGAVDPVAHGTDAVSGVSGRVLDPDSDETRHVEIPPGNPSRLTQPHSDPRVTDPGPA
jgi:hypothetical protein